MKSSSVPYTVGNPTVICPQHPGQSREEAPRDLVKGESTANWLQLWQPVLYVCHKTNVQRAVAVGLRMNLTIKYKNKSRRVNDLGFSTLTEVFFPLFSSVASQMTG